MKKNKSTTKFKWTAEIEIDPMWVEDGLNLTQECLHNLLMRSLPYLRYDEVGVKILKSPKDEDIAEKQGYASVEDFRKEQK